MTIPKIIHQTWKDAHVPTPMRALAESWAYWHPGWEYRLWTDEQNREFIRTHYPGFLSRYDEYPYPIQRADAVRYFFLHTYGGLYVDLDFECFRAFDGLLKHEECVFGLEPAEHCELHRRDKIISNALMATAPNHPFFRAIIEDLLTFHSACTRRNELILETTGPFMVNRVYDRCGPASGVTLLPSASVYPLTIFEVEEIFAQGFNDSHREKLKDAHAAHYHAGTWWRGA